MGTIDSNGIYLYEDTDSVSPLHTLLNIGQTSVSNAFQSSAQFKNVADAAARATFVSDRTTAGRPPTAADPVFVYQRDIDSFLRSTDGTTWKQSYRSPQGQWTLSGAVAVSSGVFTVAPVATPVGTPDTGISNAAGAITLARAGIYDLSVSSVWNGVGGNRRALIATINGSSIDGSGNVAGGGRVVGSHVQPPTGSVVDYTITVRFPPFNVSAGEILRVFVFHDVGSPISLNPGSATNYLGQTSITVRQIG